MLFKCYFDNQIKYIYIVKNNYTIILLFKHLRRTSKNYYQVVDCPGVKSIGSAVNLKLF